MESDKYPAASFKGKIIDEVDFKKDGIYEVRVKGDLDIHGKVQTRIVKVKITVNNKKANIDATFIVPLVDHNISIPSIVSEKIATEIEVNVNATMIQ
jgi:polyisoprenoid-binding protein YceI